jgi:hypothetical protein
MLTVTWLTGNGKNTWRVLTGAPRTNGVDSLLGVNHSTCADVGCGRFVYEDKAGRVR